MKKKMAFMLSLIIMILAVTPINVSAKSKKNDSVPLKPKITVTTKGISLSTKQIKGTVSNGNSNTYVYIGGVLHAKRVKVKNGKFTLKHNFNSAFCGCGAKISALPGEKVKFYAGTEYLKNRKVHVKYGKAKAFRVVGTALSVSKDNVSDRKITLTTHVYKVPLAVPDSFSLKKSENGKWVNIPLKENIEFPQTTNKNVQVFSLDDYFDNITTGDYKILKPGLKGVVFTIYDGVSSTAWQDNTNKKKIELKVNNYRKNAITLSGYMIPTLKKWENGAWNRVPLNAQWEGIACDEIPVVVEKNGEWSREILLDEYFDNITSGRYMISLSALDANFSFSIESVFLLDS